MSGNVLESSSFITFRQRNSARHPSPFIRVYPVKVFYRMDIIYSVSLSVMCMWSVIMYVKAEREEVGDLPFLCQHKKLQRLVEPRL